MYIYIYTHVYVYIYIWNQIIWNTAFFSLCFLRLLWPFFTYRTWRYCMHRTPVLGWHGLHAIISTVVQVRCLQVTWCSRSKCSQGPDFPGTSNIIARRTSYNYNAGNGPEYLSLSPVITTVWSKRINIEILSPRWFVLYCCIFTSWFLSSSLQFYSCNQV